VTGDKTFLDKLDTDFIVKDLVNYDYVKNAMDKYDVWKKVRGVDLNNPTHREEVFKL
jgi:NitT/TauT family transport system substrate-binding protein